MGASLRSLNWLRFRGDLLSLILVPIRGCCHSSDLAFQGGLCFASLPRIPLHAFARIYAVSSFAPFCIPDFAFLCSTTHENLALSRRFSFIFMRLLCF